MLSHVWCLVALILPQYPRSQVTHHCPCSGTVIQSHIIGAFGQDDYEIGIVFGSTAEARAALRHEIKPTLVLTSN